MVTESDRAWARWVGKTITLADRRPAIVRMARTACHCDTLWAVDAHGTMHVITSRCLASAPAPDGPAR